MRMKGTRIFAARSTTSASLRGMGVAKNNRVPSRIQKSKISCVPVTPLSPPDASLWPPYEVKDEEFVAVRKERVIQADEDPLLDAALSLLS